MREYLSSYAYENISRERRELTSVSGGLKVWRWRRRDAEDDAGVKPRDRPPRAKPIGRESRGRCGNENPSVGRKTSL